MCRSVETSLFCNPHFRLPQVKHHLEALGLLINRQVIPLHILFEHCRNRKDLGDLSELSESIKKKGVMQNLTVIPGHWDEKMEWHEDGYTLIIGHRRCAAAKIGSDKSPKSFLGLSGCW